MVIRHNTTVPAQECTSLKFGRVKKYLFILLRLSGGNAQENPGYSARPTVCSAEETRWRNEAPSMGFYISPFDIFSPPSSCYCNTLTSRPCHGSMLAFLFPASRDRVAAQLGGTGLVPRPRLAEPRGGSP